MNKKYIDGNCVISWHEHLRSFHLIFQPKLLRHFFLLFLSHPFHPQRSNSLEMCWGLRTATKLLRLTPVKVNKSQPGQRLSNFIRTKIEPAGVCLRHSDWEHRPLRWHEPYVSFLALLYRESTTLLMFCIVSSAASYVLSTTGSSKTISTPSPWSRIPARERGGGLDYKVGHAGGSSVMETSS